MNNNYGTTQYKGETYTLTSQSWVDNYGTDGDVVYYANAIKDGKKYQIMWNTTTEWDKCSELYNLEVKLEQYIEYEYDTAELEKQIKELQDEGYSSNIDDESNACDWDNADKVIELDDDADC